ncbi:ATP-dependent DNA ligase LigD ligase module /ATP-dependent DNA ligase LigD phosphoesterase module /ATP-dependent DNA ligase LigD polymerase module [Microbacterium sp. SLBN-154]|uniref:ATP-dependent DNA ligase n=1 Tax=Microbacterium sp. SLBN-154 TaxID=2768458 RepID=UPI00115116BD|nr:ATP-dependent DNA ligase [Microbacterium sp. SLBN-154]TQK19889.1 ATP-dependent DNA ligase LigD ligase module /ATP-dependent DNA ligase LigD phosphoesterase module /ATP-dependent DNA ligase LigD polymerase module [Microbacterium sp. SLBN-154]
MPGDEQLVRIGGRRLRLTNLDKVLYPETGTTKGEVIAYYTRIAPVLLPHVAGRPVTRKRWPEGVGTDAHPEMSFFAKDLEPGAPDWVPRMPIPHSGGTKEYPLVEDLPTLVYLAQVASLELHVPQWRFTADGERGDADRLVLDLDPGPGAGLAECAQVARWARDILAPMGLEPYPVTSGSKGLQLYCALPPGQTSNGASRLARELARSIEADHPDLVVSSMKKAVREGRVLIDWSQNNGSKTTIAPYSLRGRPQPTIATPRTWAELDDPQLRHLRFDEVLDRVEEIGDPLAALDRDAAPDVRVGGDAPLTAYIAKRTAGATPEPVPSAPVAHPTPPDGLPRFVIQEHHASRLHWDLRLERDGVLVSWAVPRGIPHSTARNTLAVMTEDHPMEYATFEGTIPAGQYGAGTMTIWDSGHYEPEKWRDDEIIFTAEGRPGGPLGRVRLALIRTEGQGEKSSWLLHRMKTDAAGRPQADAQPVTASPPTPSSRPSDPEREPDQSEPDLDALLAAAPDASWPPRGRDLAPMLSTSATPVRARSDARRWGSPAWAEAKWDGIRAIGVWDGRRLRLWARSGNELTTRYPEISGVDVALGDSPAIVDGELVALDHGRPSFPLLQTRMNLVREGDIAREAARTPVHYYLFDVLVVEGKDVTGLRLRHRRAMLERLAASSVPAVVTPPVFEDVDIALETSRQLRLEGVVVKDPASPYRRGARSESWLKVKLTRTQEVVIAGIRPGQGGRARTFGSLLLGIPGEEGLRYAGRVGTGFTDRDLRALQERLTPLTTDRNPLVGVPAVDTRGVQWVRPELVGEVEFGEFTPTGILRHSRWRGLRPDKHADEVVRED